MLFSTLRLPGNSLLQTVLLSIVLLVSCTPAAIDRAEADDVLPSWNEGAAKSAIINFVEEATDPSNRNFIDEKDRIAVFDNDGTLWSEKPVYFQFYFALDRVRELAPEHPEWKEEQPFRAVLENDLETLAGFGEHGILEIVMATHAGLTTDEFEQLVREWLSTARHPRFDRPFTELVYQPMIELLEYLDHQGFKSFIVSGGGIEFMRPWVEEIYGIPRDRVVGSSIRTEFSIRNGTPVILRLPAIDFIDDKEAKPVGIHKHIGRKPVMVVGNSDGDLAMMQWSASGTGKRLMAYVHHTDAEREWAYDRESAVGRLDKGMTEATERGWTLIDMKKDWNVIYPFQMEE